MEVRPLISRLIPRLRAHRVLAAGVLALLLLVWAFEWDWLRPPLERYLREHSGREVRAERLEVDWGFNLQPTVRLRGVYVENAPWAAKRPFATAAEVAFTVLVTSVWDGRPVLKRLRLVDADIDMERRADGLRNWRLRRPDDRGPGRVRVEILEAHRSRVHFVNREIDLELLAVSSPAEATGAQRPGTRVRFDGTYRGAKFSGEALTGGFVSFRASGVAFPARGYMVSRGTRIELDGQFTDIFDIGPFSTRLRLSGPTLSQLHPFVRVRPAESPPFTVDAQLTQAENVYTLSQLKARMGATDLAGEAALDRRGARAGVTAKLHSEKANLADLRRLLGMRTPPTASDPSAAADAAKDALLSRRPFNLRGFDAIDARLTFDARSLVAREAPMLESGRIEAVLERGVLDVRSFDLGVAGGRVRGSVVFDAREQPPGAKVKLEARGVRLERLAPALASSSAGAISAQASLHGSGSSLAALLAHASGSVSARMEAGRISNVADAKLALDYGRLLRAFVRGERPVDVRCAALALDLRNGAGRARELVLVTEETRVDGAGTVDLSHETLDLVLTPHPKNPGLLTKRGVIRVRGPLHAPAVSVDAGNGAPPAGAYDATCR